MTQQLKISRLTFNMFGVNTYIVWNTSTRECAVIDPGMMNQREEQAIDRFIEEHDLTVKHLINTHMHLDHIFGDRHVAERYGVKVAAGEADAFLGEKAAMQARMFQLPVSVEGVAIDRHLTDGETIDICGEEVTILAVPGHSPGSICLWFPQSHWVITGDVIFQGSIGRTDLVGGNYSQLIHAIHDKLFQLPDDTTVYPGHGDPTTIGREKQSNPYL